jgi:hypothetical protein
MANFSSTLPNPEAEPTPPASVTVMESKDFTPRTTRIVTSSSSATAATPEAQLAQIDFEKEKWKAEQAKQNEDWMKTKWRPAMGWLYMAICFCDFVAFPIIAMFMPVMIKMQYVAWKSITLDNGGLIHLAFGAILGITAFGRTQEKVAGKTK